MPRGKVKFYNEEKGYGFIEQDSGSDLFVHRSEIQGQMIREGDKVEFDIGEGRKGPCAVNVELVSD